MPEIDNRNKFLNKDTFDAIVVDMEAARNEATTQAGIATTEAGEAAASEAVATTQAGIATTEAGEAAASEAVATTQAGIATDKAGEAAASEAVATTQAGIATSEAGEAAASEAVATTQAGIATTKAAEADASALVAAENAGIAVQGVRVKDRLANTGELPVAPAAGEAYVIEVAGVDRIYVYVENLDEWVWFEVGGTAWGEISGNILDQTDLKDEFDLRAIKPGSPATNSTGLPGERRIDAHYLYDCIGVDYWTRTPRDLSYSGGAYGVEWDANESSTDLNVLTL